MITVPYTPKSLGAIDPLSEKIEKPDVMLTANPSFQRIGKNFWSCERFRAAYRTTLTTLRCRDWLVLNFSLSDCQLNEGAMNNLAHILFDTDKKGVNVAIIVQDNDLQTIENYQMQGFFSIYRSLAEFRREFYQS